MSRYFIVLNTIPDRARAMEVVRKAPHGSRVEIKAAKRTTDQNSRLWAHLTDVSLQREHHGRKYAPDKWKAIFMSALGREMQFVPALDGVSFIPLGLSSSDLSKREMTDLIDLIESWGAENGVVFHDEPERRSA